MAYHTAVGHLTYPAIPSKQIYSHEQQVSAWHGACYQLGMSERMMIGGLGGESRLFTMALMGSLLVHGTLLWWGQRLSLTNGDKEQAPFATTLEVALMPATSATPQRVVAQPARSSAERRPTRASLITKRTAAESREVPVAASQDPAPVDEEITEERMAEFAEPAQPGGAVEAAAREHYLAKVLAQIESHKFYPMTARRRGIQGNVEVCFMLDAAGGVSQLVVNGRNLLLEEAARDAIDHAMPLPPAPSPEGFPLQVSYQMIFKLQ